MFDDTIKYIRPSVKNFKYAASLRLSEQIKVHIRLAQIQEVHFDYTIIMYIRFSKVQG